MTFWASCLLAVAFSAAAEEKALRELVVRAIEEGEQPPAYVDLFGRRLRGKAVSADERGLTVHVLGQDVSLPWKELGDEGLLRLARSCASADDKEQMFVLAHFAVERESRHAVGLLDRLRELDPEAAERLAPREGSSPPTVARTVRIRRSPPKQRTPPVVAAFPGAEGFGAKTAGGRGGKVVHVTNLKEDGPGSFRAALEAEGPRIIVFDVGGTLELTRSLNLPTGNGHVTIAGQTAPGGITIVGGTLGLPGWSKKGITTDIIARHLRVRGVHNIARPGQGGDCLNVFRAERVIIDHCSFTGSMDETIDAIVSTELTFQWCTIEASALWGQGGNQHDEGDHNLGIILSYNDDTVATIHHCLFAHHKYRNPAFYRGKRCDFRNNVVYDWGLHAGTFKASEGSNIVGNTYIVGPNSKKPHIFGGAQGAGVFFLDNQHLPRYPAPADQKSVLSTCWRLKEATILDDPVKAPLVTMQESRAACELVLQHAGAWPRDTTTRRTVHEVRTRAGKHGLFGPYERFSLRTDGPTSVMFDADRDGMPDGWETSHGLNPNDPTDGKRIVPLGASEDDRHVGYTYVEFYLNEFADEIVAAPIETVTVELAIEGDGRVMCVHSGRTPMWRKKNSPKEVAWGRRHVLNKGSRVILKALPEEGSRFSHWSGGSKEETLALTVGRDVKVVAHFRAQ